MNDSEKNIVLQLRSIINQLLSGKRKLSLDVCNLEEADEALKDLACEVITLGEQYRDSYGFILELASGKLYTEPPRMNAFANPFKQLHSELRHLTWQIQEIANGDYDQCVSFSGDFSEAINKMIEALRERQVLAERNRENEYLFRSIFDTSPDGIIICDLDNKIVNLSNAAKTILMLREEPATTLQFIDLIEDEDKSKGKWFFEELLSGKLTVFAELKLKKGTNWFWSEQNASILFDSGGNPKGFIIIVRDVTERKNAEEQLLKFAGDLDESNRTKDRLFSIIAHDLKNPFNALLGFSNFLIAEVENGDMEKVKKYAQIINESANKGFELLINLLEWSRVQANRIVVTPEMLNLNDIILQNIEIGKTSALGKNIEIEFTSPGHYPAVTDKAIVNTVLRNLIGNAIKYTPQNGIIVVSVRRDNDCYVVSVKDNGTGIKEEDLPKLFRQDIIHSTPGTNNEKGTGLGLILCKDFVTKVGGVIWVESIYGQGATFFFSLPDMKQE
ncbi:MAG: PAS domain S-box protein [Bacteroidales bacterium]|jgi:PAS domain S-box-containing protein|nr:PAS domain S-box protein [Bacteroidales bacterium]